MTLTAVSQMVNDLGRGCTKCSVFVHGVWLVMVCEENVDPWRLVLQLLFCNIHVLQ